jgi:hypothetical protein
MREMLRAVTLADLFRPVECPGAATSGPGRGETQYGLAVGLLRPLDEFAVS